MFPWPWVSRLVVCVSGPNASGCDARRPCERLVQREKAIGRVSAATAMPRPDLPPEILDSIVEFLYGETKALKQCCLVSKSWIPRTRKHLFAVIKFCNLDDIEAWKKTFPDPSNSPAHHTCALEVYCSEVISVPTFPCLVRLEVISLSSQMNLTPFYELPPTLKSLFLSTIFTLPLSKVFNLIRSLPSLENLSLIGSEDEINYNDPDDPYTVVPSPPSPPLSGTLKLCLFGEIAGTVRRLLGLPSGLHFRVFRLQWYEREDLRHIVDLVTACSHTLEFLELTYAQKGTSSFRSTNLLS